MSVTSCDGCGGACCTHIILRMPAHAEAARWLALHASRVDGDRYTFDVRCSALDADSGRCLIYDRRPECCRVFAVGGPDCLAARQYVVGRVS